jgi:hypothetical protein
MAVSKTASLLEMTDQRIHRIYAHWQEKRGNRPMPARHDIDAVDLTYCLGYVCLIEVLRDPGPRFRFRVDGSNLADLTGFEMTGKFADEIPDLDYRDLVVELYGQVVSGKEPIFRREDESWNDTGMKIESVSLPLSSDAQSVDYILELIVPVDTWIS